MAILKMEQRDNFDFPEGVWLDATLEKVEVREIEFQRKVNGVPQYANGQRVMDTLVKLSWTFLLNYYAGRKVWGETWPEFDTRDNCMARVFVEAVTGITYEPGDEIDTDDLQSLPCQVMVRHESRDAPDGTTRYRTPVSQVAPPGTGDSYVPEDVWQKDGKPPF